MFILRTAPLQMTGKLALLLTLAFCAGNMRAQCAPLQVDPSKLPSHKASRQPLLPESAYLSDTNYTNVYFGFSLDLPIPAQGHLIKLPLMPERQHALLAMGFQNGDRSGSLTINAIEPVEGLEGFSAKQQHQQLSAQSQAPIPGATPDERQTQPQIGPQGTLIAPQPQLGLPEFHLPAERFHSSLRHYGEKYRAQYWTQVRNYKIGVLIATNDKDFLQKSRQAMAAVRFYCMADDGTLASKEGKLVVPEGEPYEGPTVPTWLADNAIQRNPGLQIPPGEIREGAYHNPDFGLDYHLPKGWDVLPAHNGGNPPADLSSLREFELLHACSRTLLRIEQHRSGDAAGTRRMPTIILRALDPACLSMRLPSSPGDYKIAEEVGASLEVLSEFGQITANELVSISDRLFMVFHGTIATPAEGEMLAQRLSQTIFATRHNKMMFVWSFLAPTSEELAAMPAGGISFDGATPIELQANLSVKR